MHSRIPAAFKAAVRIGGLVLIGLAVFVGFVGLDLHWGFFGWDPKPDLWTVGLLLLGVVGLLLLFVVARRTRSYLHIFTVLVMGIALATIGINEFHREPGYFGGPEPMWYRLSRTGVLLIPLLVSIAVLYAKFRQRKLTN